VTVQSVHIITIQFKSVFSGAIDKQWIIYDRYSVDRRTVARQSQHRDGRAKVRQPLGRFAAQMGGRGGRLPAGLPERHDGL